MQRDSEDEPAQVPEPVPASPTARLVPPLRRRRALARLGGVAATVVLLGLVLALAGVPFPSLTPLLPLPYHPPDGWHSYTDPNHSFRVWIPPVWASQVSDTYEAGLCIREDCFNSWQESVLLGPTPQDPSSFPTSFAILIQVDPITSGLAVEWWCRSQARTDTPNASIDGVPALRTETSDGRPEWELFTAHAYFAIQPVAAHSTAEQQMTETLVAGFTPATPQPLPCSRS